MGKTRAGTVIEYGTCIDDMVRSIRKWMTEMDDVPGREEILRKCEDMFFTSELSYRTLPHESEIIIDSMHSGS